MDDLAKLGVLALIVTLIAVGCYFIYSQVTFEGNLVIDSYKAKLTTDGTLVETFQYNVKAGHQYHMLYRYWDSTVTYDTSFSNIPYIRVIDVSCSFVPYIKDYKGTVTLFKTDNVDNQKNYIEYKAYNNEVGCYNPNYFEKGIYSIQITYNIVPPVEYDNEWYHLNLKLADDHNTYKKVEIEIEDTEGNIGEIFTHPSMDVTKTEAAYLIRGTSPNDVLLEIEYLSKNISFGIQSYQPNIYEKTISSNSRYRSTESTISMINSSLLIICFGFGFILCGLYFFFGREKNSLSLNT